MTVNHHNRQESCHLSRVWWPGGNKCRIACDNYTRASAKRGSLITLHHGRTLHTERHGRCTSFMPRRNRGLVALRLGSISRGTSEALIYVTEPFGFLCLKLEAKLNVWRTFGSESKNVLVLLIYNTPSGPACEIRLEMGIAPGLPRRG